MNTARIKKVSFRSAARLGGWCLAMLLAQGALAASTVSNTFSVNVTLSSLCTATSTQNIDFGTYTAFGSASTPSPTANLVFTCTRGLNAPTFSLDTVAGFATSTAPGTVGGGSATGDGLLGDVGLNYHLSIAGTKSTTGTAPTTAPGSLGTPDAYTFTVTGSMPSGQAGTCATGNCTNAPTALNGGVRTLTITY